MSTILPGTPVRIDGIEIGVICCESLCLMDVFSVNCGPESYAIIQQLVMRIDANGQPGGLIDFAEASKCPHGGVWVTGEVLRGTPLIFSDGPGRSRLLADGY